jgi:hypothetical protein
MRLTFLFASILCGRMISTGLCLADVPKEEKIRCCSEREDEFLRNEVRIVTMIVRNFIVVPEVRQWKTAFAELACKGDIEPELVDLSPFVSRILKVVRRRLESSEELADGVGRVFAARQRLGGRVFNLVDLSHVRHFLRGIDRSEVMQEYYRRIEEGVDKRCRSQDLEHKDLSRGELRAIQAMAERIANSVEDECFEKLAGEILERAVLFYNSVQFEQT